MGYDVKVRVQWRFDRTVIVALVWYGKLSEPDVLEDISVNPDKPWDLDGRSGCVDAVATAEAQCDGHEEY